MNTNESRLYHVCVLCDVTQPKYMKPEMCINLPATKRLLTKDVRYPVETKSISAPDMVDPSQPKWAVIVVGLPELPLTLKRARIEPMLAPSASNDISGSFHRARLLFPILHVSIQRNQRNSISWWTKKRQKGKKINKIQLAILLAVWLASTSRLLRSVQKSWDCAAGPALLERGRWTCSPSARPFVTARTSNRPPSATAQNLCHSELSLDTKSFPKTRTHTHRPKKKRRQ